MVSLELSWGWWVHHLDTKVLQGAYDEVQFSAILDLVGSSHFMSYPQLVCNSFKGRALPSFLLFHFEVYLLGLTFESSNSFCFLLFLPLFLFLCMFHNFLLKTTHFV